MRKRIIGRSALFYFGTLLTLVELVAVVVPVIQLERGAINVVTYKDKIGGQFIYAMHGLCAVAIYSRTSKVVNDI